ncbi:formate dehydrogenase (plasmid) [Microvirga terrae]|uniref:Formate dehydrogenase n=1 Tax=Microvirga terrae TaxID=2740529 RepID=A0ABY5S0U5_9HYPH|nr:formate dehydrogenase [Microvirga terrae]UVF22174.1 formate dehydrogenase [Microvirga terrae]
MSRSKSRETLNRRNFILALGGGSAAIATAPQLAVTSAQAFDAGSEETKARYRESNDVKAFYRTNGYETLRK